MNAISFEPSKADLIAANRLHFWASAWRRRTILSYLAGALMFSALCTLLMWDGSVVAGVIGAISGFAFWSLILASILLLNYLHIPGRSRRAFEQQKSLQDRVEVEWSNDRIRLASAHGNSDFDWQDFIRVETGRDVILLYQSDYLFNFIPKRALPGDQAADIIRTAVARRS